MVLADHVAADNMLELSAQPVEQPTSVERDPPIEAAEGTTTNDRDATRAVEQPTEEVPPVHAEAAEGMGAINGGPNVDAPRAEAVEDVEIAATQAEVEVQVDVPEPVKLRGDTITINFFGVAADDAYLGSSGIGSSRGPAKAASLQFSFDLKITAADSWPTVKALCIHAMTLRLALDSDTHLVGTKIKQTTVRA